MRPLKIVLLDNRRDRRQLTALPQELSALLLFYIKLPPVFRDLHALSLSGRIKGFLLSTFRQRIRSIQFILLALNIYTSFNHISTDIQLTEWKLGNCSYTYTQIVHVQMKELNTLFKFFKRKLQKQFFVVIDMENSVDLVLQRR